MIYLQYNLFKSRITVYLNRNDWIFYSQGREFRDTDHAIMQKVERVSSCFTYIN